MRKYISLFVLALLAFNLTTSCTSEEEKIAAHNALVEKTLTTFETQLLGEKIDSVFSKYDFNGIVAVFRDSVKLYEKAQGFSDFQAKKKIDSASVFAVGSISKQFTAALILEQVAQGKLKLTDKAAQYLESFQRIPEYREITIKELLNHSSGIYVMGNALVFKPGTGFRYSNDGFNALGKILEKVTGKSYTENAVALFKKAGLKNTFTDANFSGTDFASAYLGKPANASEVPDMPSRLGTQAVGTPAGGVLSTVGDLNRWNQALYGGKILKPEILNQMITPSNVRKDNLFGKVGYGFGLMMYGDGPLAYYHTGYVKGAPSINIYYPKTKTSVIVLSNLADETRGMDPNFLPHGEIKAINDLVQNAIVVAQKEMLQQPKK